MQLSGHGNAPYVAHYKLFEGEDGLPRWSHSQVLATKYCMCKFMHVSENTAVSGIYYSGS